MDGPVDVVLPVKELPRAKSRLAGVSEALDGPTTERRRAHHDLALALVADTLAAVLAASVRSVLVVTSDPHARALCRAMGGARAGAGSGRVATVADGGDGLDAAVRLGAAHLRARRVRRAGPAGETDEASAVAALQADLPALRAEELDAALHRARPVLDRGVAAYVADHTGAGTTLLITPPGALPEPRFGAGSAAAHAALGAVALDGEWPGLRTDVDTPADLDLARTLGVGPATAGWPSRRRVPAAGMIGA